jgi:hypothetical protein
VEKMERSFKGIWIPKEIWLTEDLGWTEKFLLAEIDSLAANNECFATNEYFAKFFNISKDRVSKLVSSLCTKGYTEVKLIYKPGTKQVQKRIITTIGYRQKQLEGIGENNYTPIGENNEDINTSFIKPINNTKELYIRYGEFVQMKETEYNKLVEEFGKDGTDERIERLDLYKGSTGKKYKDDYRTILSWERRNNQSKPKNKKEINWEGFDLD